FVLICFSFHLDLCPISSLVQSSSNSIPWTYDSTNSHDIDTQSIDHIDSPNQPTNSHKPDVTDSALPVVQEISDNNSDIDITDHVDTFTEPTNHEAQPEQTNTETTTINTEPLTLPTLRNSTRPSIKPKHLSDYLCNLSQGSSESSPSGLLYPIADYHSYANVSDSLSKFAMSIVTDIEPKSYKEDMAKITTVRALIALVSIKAWHLHQMDVYNAFLHGDLQEDVYMTVPQGVTCPKPNQVCKLLKSLYGLRQASRKWYEKLTGLLIQQGNSLVEFDRIKKVMDNEFKIKDLGSLKYFLGIEVAHSKSGISICQRKYCLDLLQDTGLIGSKPALEPSIKLHQDNSAAYEDIEGYRRLVGKLLYLTTTRPDIAFATQQLSQFLSAPTITHYETACRVVRYLKGTPGRGLFFPRSSTVQILGFTDADWANCVDTRRSTSGYCFFIGSSLISWRAKKQNTVSRSSSEAEYRSLSFASCELQWLLYLLKDLQVTCVRPAALYCDNQSAIHIASNPVFHERTKHLEIDCHFVRDKVQQGIFKLLPISTKSQLADFFTKALPPKTFNTFISKLSMINIYHTPACGRVLSIQDQHTMPKEIAEQVTVTHDSL
ncbi:retrovirus-related pol polyprotein from transposon TNT 1-94, partial [Trifolium medium]|nr:retrovirus-related pol polyprotein from transposon TNT 1-94 [Trifolium medium]